MRGFSLIEILVVVALIAIITAIALPSYNWAMQKSRRVEGKTQLRTIMAAEERYYAAANRYTGEAGAAGISIPLQSLPGNYYMLSSISVSEDGQSVTVEVAPQASQRNDGCGNLMLDSTGRKGSSGSLEDPGQCW